MAIGDILKKTFGNEELKEKDISVLVVEDENYLRSICNQKLTKQGFRVIEALDGESALNQIIKHKPDIILLDIILPYMDGFEVIGKIRKSPNQEISGIPIVVMSNLDDKNDINKAIDLGANGYLVKAHFTVDQIISKLINTLKESGKIKVKK